MKTETQLERESDRIQINNTFNFLKEFFPDEEGFRIVPEDIEKRIIIRLKQRAYLNTPMGRLLKRRRGWKRLEKKKKIIEIYTLEEWIEKLEKTKGICPSCREDVGIMKLSLDHIYPISKAYKDYKKTGIKHIYTIKDIQPLCKSCNSKKGKNENSNIL